MRARQRGRDKLTSFEEVEEELVKRLKKDMVNEVDRMIINDLLKESKTVYIKTYWDD
jgi:hypothetical protein